MESVPVLWLIMNLFSSSPEMMAKLKGPPFGAESTSDTTNSKIEYPTGRSSWMQEGREGETDKGTQGGMEERKGGIEVEREGGREMERKGGREIVRKEEEEEGR